MHIRNNNPLDLSVDEGEEVAVTVRTTGTSKSVTFLLNHAPWSNSSFVAQRSVADPYELRVTVQFSSSTGGVYEVTLVGANGSLAQYTIGQANGERLNSVFFTLDVV